jgi:lipoyl(octanoyl) transferase
MQATAATKNKTTSIIPLGLIDYQEAWDYQEQLFAKTVAMKISNRDAPVEEKVPTPNYLVYCYHPHVFTLGKSGKEENLLVNDVTLGQIEAKYYKINRGGDITYHGPGQLVVYPIIDLDNFFTDIHKYLRLLEEAVIVTLGEFGIVAGRIEGLTGVWIDHVEQKNPRKICAMGVKASRWVTMHGLALNVNTNLDYFKYIVPCGIDDKAVTSIQQELGTEANMAEVEQALLGNIARLFEREIETA